MRQIFVEQRSRLLDRRPVSREDGRDVERAQAVQRAEVGPHVAVRGRDDGRPGREHGVSGEEPSTLRLVEAAVPGFVPRRVHDHQAAAGPGDLVAIVEQRRRSQRAAGQRERGAATVDRDRAIEIERAADVIGVNVREYQPGDRDPLVRESAPILRVERSRVELDGVA